MKARSDRGLGGGEDSLPNQSRFPPSSPIQRPKSSQIYCCSIETEGQRVDYLVLIERGPVRSSGAERSAAVGVKWGQRHAKWAEARRPSAPINSGIPGAGGTGIEPATCGFGAQGS